MFTYYLAYVIYWRDVIQSASSLTPSFLFATSGLAIVVLFVAALFTEQARTNTIGDNS